MPGHDIIVIGASAGGVETLTKLVRNLPPDLPAAVFVVLHFPSHGTSVLPSILNRAGTLPASHYEDGETIQPGRIYVASPDRHLLVKPGCIRSIRGPRENSHRPAIDPLFRTAARAYGNRVVGVVLSGVLDDGTAGLAVIKQQGGIAVVQDPDDALYPGMPNSAIANVAVDHILPLSKIASILVHLAHQPVVEGPKAVPKTMETESDMAELDLTALNKDEKPGTPSGFGCPECGGVLWELSNGKLSRFRCRTGHAYSPESLLAEQSDGIESALWSALRALEESATLTRRMAERSQRSQLPLVATRFHERAAEAEANAALLRQLLLQSEPKPTTEQVAMDGALKTLGEE